MLMELPSYFSDFLREIRPTSNQIGDYKTGHRILRQRLWNDEELSPIIVSMFLQGSCRRATAGRPQGDKRPDVDVIVVTKLSKDEYTPSEALKAFIPFLEKHYKGKYQLQGRSIGICLSYVDLDLVITAAPSESEIGILESDSVATEDTPEDVDDWKLAKSWVSLAHRSAPGSWRLLEAAKGEPEWKLSPLLIPDREAERWEPTHPLAQIQWTWGKNRRCNGHYVNVVKALKWWRQINHSQRL
jgi:Second Messenger Oligonucleotide or Dinucleotide Synthetase domain